MPYSDRSNGAIDPVTNAPLKGTVGVVASAGANQGNAAALPYAVNRVTGADAAKGVILPAVDESRIGSPIQVINNAAAVLLVYPPVGGTINGGAANASVSLAANTTAEFTVHGVNTYWGPEAVQA